MSSIQQQREVFIAKEKKWAFFKAIFINFLLLFYSMFSVTYYASHLFYHDNYIPSWAYILFLVLSLGAAIAWSFSRNSLGCMAIYKTNKFLKNRPELFSEFKFKSPSGIFFILIFLVTFLLSGLLVDINFYLLFSYQGIQGAKRIFEALFNPNWSIIGNVLGSMVETVFIAFLATALAIPVAFVLSFFTARNLMNRSKTTMVLYNVLRLIANFTRSVEPLVWAVVFSVWVSVGPFAGMLALMLHSIASLIKLYSEQIESINKGPVEAIESTGAHPVLVVWYSVVPQIILPYLSFTIYRWDINVRMATVIGLVGGGGIGTLLVQYQGLAQWNEVGTIVIVIAIVVWLMDYLSSKLREAIY